MTGGSLRSRRAQASALLAGAVLVPLAVVLLAAAHATSVSPWPVLATVLGAAVAGALLTRRRDRPYLWRVTVRWAGLTAAVGVAMAATGLSALLGPWLPAVSALTLQVMAMFALPLLAAALAGTAQARLLGAPTVELAASTVTFVLPLRGLGWDLWFGRDSLILAPPRRRKIEARVPVVALRWADVSSAVPGRVGTPLARCTVAAGTDLPYTMGEVVLVRGRGGHQWLLPADSGREVAELVERARRARRRDAGDARDDEAASISSGPLGLDTLFKVVAPVLLLAALGGIGLWRVVTGQDGPVALLGVLFFWSPLLAVGLLLRHPGRDPKQAPSEPEFTPSWGPVPGWEPL
ncbi:MAG: hypothetical protein ACT4RN_09875 [Pseudonocardia sp.]